MSCFAGPGLITNGLVLYLDAGNIESYTGSGTTWTDLSGNGNNGTLTNGPTYSSSTGGSIVFDGVDDYVTTSYAPTFTDFTIITWFICTGNNNQYQQTLDKDYIEGTWAGIPEPGVINSWGGGVLEPIAPFGRYITLPYNSWHMLTSRRQGTTHTILGDGITNTTSGTVSSAPLSASNFIFGGIQGGSGGSLNGSISNTLVYNRALSDAEVLKNFNALRGRYSI
jgi:hypothetical protein